MNASVSYLDTLPKCASIDGAKLLNDTRDFIRRFCAFPDEHCLIAVTLWAAHAHMVEHFYTSPRLAIVSPEVSSGKTRVLEVLDLLVPASFLTLNASPAAIFRTLAQRRITLLFDEVEAIWSKRGQDDSHEDLRALLNSGYKMGASIPRCVGPRHDVVQFKVFCAVALAGIGDLPDTIMSRSVIVRMRRRAPHEEIEPFRSRAHEPVGHAMRDQLAKWAETVGPTVGAAWPALPAGIVDRPAEVWEPLLAVADAAGGDWPDVARAACVNLCRIAEDRRVSLGVRLLADMRIVLGDAIALHTETILERLIAGDGLDDDAPWADLHGKALGKRGLASMLKRYEIHPVKVKIDGRALQGYRREPLWDAWQRYLPAPSLVPAQAEPPEPPEPALVNQQLTGSVSGSGGSGTRIRPEPTQLSQATDFSDKVPEVPEVPDIRTPESVVCLDCRYLQPRDGPFGWCRRYETETGQRIPFQCSGFEPASGSGYELEQSQSGIPEQTKCFNGLDATQTATTAQDVPVRNDDRDGGPGDGLDAGDRGTKVTL